jgi:hypothetical protein
MMETHGTEIRTKCAPMTARIPTTLPHFSMTKTMPHSSKRKGNRYEREVVGDAEAAGLEAERAYASDGRSLGEAEECDVLIRRRDANVLDAVRVQAKRRKSIAQYLQPPEGADVVVTREDRGDSLAVVPLTLFLDLLRNQTEEE